MVAYAVDHQPGYNKARDWTHHDLWDSSPYSRSVSWADSQSQRSLCAQEGVMREDFGDGAVREELTLDPELLGLDQFDEDDDEEEDEEPKVPPTWHRFCWVPVVC